MRDILRININAVNFVRCTRKFLTIIAPSSGKEITISISCQSLFFSDVYLLNSFSFVGTLFSLPERHKTGCFQIHACERDGKTKFFVCFRLLNKLLLVALLRAVSGPLPPPQPNASISPFRRLVVFRFLLSRHALRVIARPPAPIVAARFGGFPSRGLTDRGRLRISAHDRPVVNRHRAKNRKQHYFSRVENVHSNRRTCAYSSRQRPRHAMAIITMPRIYPDVGSVLSRGETGPWIVTAQSSAYIIIAGRRRNNVPRRSPINAAATLPSLTRRSRVARIQGVVSDRFSFRFSLWNAQSEPRRSKKENDDLPGSLVHTALSISRTRVKPTFRRQSTAREDG